MRPTITFCICTSGRPHELSRCLTSIMAGSRMPAEVIVSDDSGDILLAREVREVCDGYSFVRYIVGPRRGLCANRNHVIREASSTHVSLLDDDATISADFVERAEALIGNIQEVVWTGDVLEGGVKRLSPTNPTFLGHFGRPVRQGGRLENINLNCNVFPRQAFEAASFDETIAYGYEDTDLCAQLISLGYVIKHEPSLVNSHLPPVISKHALRERHDLAEQARLTVLWRRWAIHRRRPVIGLIAFGVAVVHRFVHRSRRLLRREATV